MIGDMLEPVWEDDDIDERIDNILRAFREEFGRPWKWGRGLWDPEGVYVSKNAKAKVEEKGEKKRPGDFAESSGKSHCPGPSTAMEFNLLDSIKQEINSWGAALLEEMKDGFGACESRFDMLNEKVEGMATDLLKVKGDAGAKSKADTGSKEKTASTDETEKEEEPATLKPDMNKAGQSLKDHSPPIDPQQSSPKGVLSKEKPTHPIARKGKKVVVSSDSSDTEEHSSPVFIKEGFPTVDELSDKAKKQEPRIEAVRLASQGKAERVKRLAQSQRTPYQGDNTARSIVCNPPPKAKYNPFQKADYDKKKALLAFLQKDPTFNHDEDDKSRQCLCWYVLRTRSKWLTDSHMDAVLNLLRHRYTEHPELFRSNKIAFLDAMFSHLWTSKYFDFVSCEPNPDDSGRVLPAGAFSYHAEEYPPFAQTNKQWGLEVDDLYAPLNVKASHWVALWISIPSRHITVWDSIPSCCSDEELAAAIEPIAVMIPYVLRTLASSGMKHLYSYERFTHERIVKGVPPNKKPGDCGVYTLKYIECHAHGLTFPSTLCDASMTWIREKIACDLFHDIACYGPNEHNYVDDFGLYDPPPIRDAP